jgi:uncharacterized protein
MNPPTTSRLSSALSRGCERERVDARPLAHARGYLSPRPPAPDSAVVAVAKFFLRLPAAVLLAAIRLYQRALAPALPALFGPACGCRFSPTCSHYAAEAIRTRGALVGTALAAIRLLKCTPLHPGGFDPVPAPRRAPPRCTRLPA